MGPTSELPRNNLPFFPSVIYAIATRLLIGFKKTLLKTLKSEINAGNFFGLRQGMIWNETEDDFSILHIGNFFPLHTKNLAFHSSFHTTVTFSSILHSILPHQGKFRLEETRCLYCTFATLSVPLQAVPHSMV